MGHFRRHAKTEWPRHWYLQLMRKRHFALGAFGGLDDLMSHTAVSSSSKTSDDDDSDHKFIPKVVFTLPSPQTPGLGGSDPMNSTGMWSWTWTTLTWQATRLRLFTVTLHQTPDSWALPVSWVPSMACHISLAALARFNTFSRNGVGLRGTSDISHFCYSRSVTRISNKDLPSYFTRLHYPLMSGKLSHDSRSVSLI